MQIAWGRLRVAAAGASATALAMIAGVAPAEVGARVTDPYLPDTMAPIVTISQAPKSESRTTKRRKRVTFAFESDDPQAIFTCKVDSGAFEPCTSPVTVYFTGAKGKGRRHTFLVRAADLAGNSSGTAVRSLRVIRVKPRQD